jgi:hypothetical protein
MQILHLGYSFAALSADLTGEKLKSTGDKVSLCFSPL